MIFHHLLLGYAVLLDVDRYCSISVSTNIQAIHYTGGRACWWVCMPSTQGISMRFKHAGLSMQVPWGIFAVHCPCCRNGVDRRAWLLSTQLLLLAAAIRFPCAVMTAHQEHILVLV